MEIVTLDEAKKWLRVDFDDEDALIVDTIKTAERLCLDVARMSSMSKLAAYPGVKTAVLYATAYLYEHREDADLHALTLQLRAMLFGPRKAGF